MLVLGGKGRHAGAAASSTPLLLCLARRHEPKSRFLRFLQMFRVEVQARLPFLANIGVATQLFLAGLGVRRGAELYLHLTAEPSSLLAWIDSWTSP